VTFVPGLAASNCLPNSVKVSVSDAAANTVMLPDSADELAEGVDELDPHWCRCCWTRNPQGLVP
jgi:hypothetical protein